MTDKCERSILFVGTGTSGCVPSIGCLLPPRSNSKACRLCPHAHAQQTFNHRLNTSILYQKKVSNVDKVNGPSLIPADRDLNGPSIDSDMVNILVDCGKTFLWQSLSLFPQHKIPHITALLLTHPHADAILGLDDLRGWTMDGAVQKRIDVYCDLQTMQYVKRVFPYLVDSKMASGGGDVADLVFHLLPTVSSANKNTDNDSSNGENISNEVEDENGYCEFEEFVLGGVKVKPFHVQHGTFQGKPFYSVGYIIDDSVVYISDISHMPPQSAYLLTQKNSERRFNMVIVDALHDKPHASHYSFRQSLEMVFELEPKSAVFTGFTHRIDHFKYQHCVDRCVERYVKSRTKRINDEEYLDFTYDKTVDIEDPSAEDMQWPRSLGDQMFVKLAWDGLRIDLDADDRLSIARSSVGLRSREYFSQHHLQ